jgi:hypothetical protein
MKDRVASTVNLGLLAAVLFACDSGAKVKEYTARFRPAIEQNLAALPSIATQVRTLPPLQQDGVEDTPSFIVAGLSDNDESPTASLCYAEDLADPIELGYVWGRIDKTGAINQCVSMIHRGHLAYDPAEPKHPLKSAGVTEAKKWYPDCARYRYLLVIRTLEFIKPSSATLATRPFVPMNNAIDTVPVAPVPAPSPMPPKRSRRGAATSAPASQRDAGVAPDATVLMPEEASASKKVTRYMFEGGSVRAELLVFSLPSAKFLGGFRFSAQSSVEISGTDSMVEADFKAQIKAALRQAMKRTFPSMSLSGVK